MHLRKKSSAHMSGFPAMYGENTALMEAMGYTSVQSLSSHQPVPQVFITARVRSTREGTVFTGVCLYIWGGGVPRPGLDGGGRGVPHLRSGVGGGVPHPGLDGGGVTPSQVWGGGGISHPRSEVGGVPQPGLDGGGYPIPGGVPEVTPHHQDLGWGTP